MTKYPARNKQTKNVKPKIVSYRWSLLHGWRDALRRIRSVDTPFKFTGEIEKVVINVK